MVEVWMLWTVLLKHPIQIRWPLKVFAGSVYTPAGVCSATRSAIINGMDANATGAHHHRSCRAALRGKDMENMIKMFTSKVTPLFTFQENGYHTFNEGTGKDDLISNGVLAFYDRVGDGTLKALRMVLNGSRYVNLFGQIQLRG